MTSYKAIEAPDEITDVIIAELQERAPVRQEGKGWRTRCPNSGHDDVHPSFFLYPGGGGRCFSQCNRYWPSQEMAELLGVNLPEKKPGLTITELAQAKGLPQEFLRSLGVTDGVAGSGKNRLPCVDIAYCDQDGNILAIRKRLSLDGSPRFVWRRGDHPVLYGLPHIRNIQKLGWVILVEGETDCWTLWKNQIPALGLPGASMWQPEYASLVDGLMVYVWHEPNGGGDALVKATSTDIPGIQVIEAPPDTKDPSELYLRDPQHFKDRIQSLMRAALPTSELRAEAISSEARALFNEAKAALEDPGLLHKLVEATESMGYVDDRENVAALHLAVLSRLLSRPLSVVVKGPSSAGKSHLVHSVLKVHPTSAAYVLSAMSERALAYSEEPLSHRFLVLEEAAALDKKFTTYLVRSLLSEGCLRYETVEKTAEGLRPRRIEREGPTGLITTTTAHALDYEMETRVLTLEVKESPSHLRNVLRSIASRHDRDADPTIPAELEAALGWLELAGERRVQIPFSNWLADRLPVDRVAVRLTRDFGVLLSTIKASAILYQQQRGRDADGCIVASVADYSMAVAAIGDPFECASNDALTEAQRRAVDAVQAMCEDYGRESVSVSAAADWLAIHPSNAGRHLRAAAAKGFLINNNAGEKGRPAAYVLGATLPEERTFLPTVEELSAAFPALAGDWVDPITGECVYRTHATEPQDRTGSTCDESEDSPHGSPQEYAEATEAVQLIAHARSDSGQAGVPEKSCGRAVENGGINTHLDIEKDDVGEL